MSKRKVNSTSHYLLRAKERLNWNENSALEQARLASKYGASWGNIRERDIQLYVFGKEGKGKRAKLYHGNIFIFSQTSNRCYTVYPLPNLQ